MKWVLGIINKNNRNAHRRGLLSDGQMLVATNDKTALCINSTAFPLGLYDPETFVPIEVHPNVVKNTINAIRFYRDRDMEFTEILDPTRFRADINPNRVTYATDSGFTFILPSTEMERIKAMDEPLILKYNPILANSEPLVISNGPRMIVVQACVEK